MEIRLVNIYEDGWSGIAETEPDEWDLAIIREAETDPECRIIAPEDEVRRVMGEEAV